MNEFERLPADGVGVGGGGGRGRGRVQALHAILSLKISFLQTCTSSTEPSGLFDSASTRRIFNPTSNINPFPDMWSSGALILIVVVVVRPYFLCFLSRFILFARINQWECAFGGIVA